MDKALVGQKRHATSNVTRVVKTTRQRQRRLLICDAKKEKQGKTVSMSVAVVAGLRGGCGCWTKRPLATPSAPPHFLTQLVPPKLSRLFLLFLVSCLSLSLLTYWLGYGDTGRDSPWHNTQRRQTGVFGQRQHQGDAEPTGEKEEKEEGRRRIGTVRTGSTGVVAHHLFSRFPPLLFPSFLSFPHRSFLIFSVSPFHAFKCGVKCLSPAGKCC